MSDMMLRIYPENPAPRHIKMVLDVLSDGGVVIYPTDSVYAIGCDMNNQKAIDKLCRIIGKKPEDANLAIICYDLSNISEYTVPFSNGVYKMMKSSLPGPYTFILKANNKVPKLFKNKKKEIGIRVPDNAIPRTMVQEFGSPIVTASIKLKNGETTPNPEDIYEQYKNDVDLIIDGGMGSLEGTTVLDCTGDEVVLIREGIGEVEVVD
ncbi:MAG: threonylcarbamoyl-AMP synthase [Bacteroidetes bacterium]|nr:threonylcarbamoyl-AMP synthase [Bacteroidota bacterium]